MLRSPKVTCFYFVETPACWFCTSHSTSVFSQITWKYWKLSSSWVKPVWFKNQIFLFIAEFNLLLWRILYPSCTANVSECSWPASVWCWVLLTSYKPISDIKSKDKFCGELLKWLSLLMWPRLALNFWEAVWLPMARKDQASTTAVLNFALFLVSLAF